MEMVWEVISPAITGIGSVLEALPMARISAASCADTPGWATRKSSSCCRVAPLVEAAGRTLSAITSVGVDVSGSLDAALEPPYSATIAGPAVTVTVVPFSPAGMAGAALPARTAAASAVAASKVNVALPLPITSQRTAVGTSARSTGRSAFRPVAAAACAAPATSRGSTLLRCMWPYPERSGRPLRSPTVSATGATWVGEKIDSHPAALADTTRPAATTGTTTAPIAQRRTATRGGVVRARPACAPSVMRWRRRARAASVEAVAASGRASSAAAKLASAATPRARCRQRSHRSRCSRSRLDPANLSSWTRRSAPSLRCRTSDLLSQRRFSAPHHCSDGSLLDAHRGGHRRIAEAAVAEHKHCGRPLRQPGQRSAQHPPVVGLLHCDGGVDGLCRGGGQLLTPRPSPVGAQDVQRGVRRGRAHPPSRPGLLAAVAAVKGEEGVLGDVLSLAAITEDARGDADHSGVFSAKDAIERLVGDLGDGGGDGHAPDGLSIHTCTAPPTPIL